MSEAKRLQILPRSLVYQDGTAGNEHDIRALGGDWEHGERSGMMSPEISARLASIFPVGEVYGFDADKPEYGSELLEIHRAPTEEEIAALRAVAAENGAEFSGEVRTAEEYKREFANVDQLRKESRERLNQMYEGKQVEPPVSRYTRL